MKILRGAWVERGPESTGKLDEVTWNVEIQYCNSGETRTVRLDFVVGGEVRFSRFAVHVPEDEFRAVSDVIVGLSPETASPRMIQATEMAGLANVDPKTYRRVLRAGNFPWHTPGASWTVEVGSPEYNDMIRVLGEMVGKTPLPTKIGDGP